MDPAAGAIAGAGGREQLDPKVMDVLVELARHVGHVVAREDLLATLWPNMVVTDDALSRCIYELRRHLSQVGGDKRYHDLVETLPKRGYRLHGTVTPLQPAPGAPASSHRWQAILATAIAIVVAAISWIGAARRASDVAGSIAVLPFVDLSEKRDQQYFTDGIAEEILNRLAQSDELDVKARTSSFALRDRPLDVRDIAAQLGVGHVLEGSVRRSKDRIRVTAQLIDASTNAHVWSATYDRSIGDIFVVQDEIAAAVAAALKVELTGAALRSPSLANEQAFEAFLQGEYFYNRRLPGDIALSVKYYEQAVELDPGYAKAWASLAGGYNLMDHEDGTPAVDWSAKRAAAAHRAVELDPDLAVAYVRLAQHYWTADDSRRGTAYFDKAVQRDPNDTLVLAVGAGRAMRRGNLEEAVRLQRRAVTRDPLSTAQRHNLGMYLSGTGRLNEALAELRKARDLAGSTPNNEDLPMISLLVLLNRPDEAEPLIADLAEGERDYALALWHYAQGRPAAADAALARLVAKWPNVDSVQLAGIYAFRGMRDEAFATLDRAKESALNDPHTLIDDYRGMQENMRGSPLLLSLHTDPRWKTYFE